LIAKNDAGPVFKISVRFSSSRKFPDGVGEIRVGPYLLKPIPSADGEEAILDFNDEWEASGRLLIQFKKPDSCFLGWLLPWNLV